MPIYEFACNTCSNHFDLLRHSYDDKEPAFCPVCHDKAERQLSSFSYYSALKPDSAEKIMGNKDERHSHVNTIIEEHKTNNPDPLKSWREERCKTLKVGPEKWQDWAKDKIAEEKKTETYGKAWTRTEV